MPTCCSTVQRGRGDDSAAVGQDRGSGPAWAGRGFSGVLFTQTGRTAYLDAAVASQAAPGLKLLTGVAVAFPRSPFVTAATARELQEAALTAAPGAASADADAPCDEDCNRAAARLQRRGPILSVVTIDGRKDHDNLNKRSGRGLNVESATRSSSGCGDMRPMRSPDGWASWVRPRPPMR